MTLTALFAGLAIALTLATACANGDGRPTARIEAGAGHAQTATVSTERSTPRSVRAVLGRPAAMQRAPGEPEGA